MCGIAGIWGKVEADALAKMTNAQAHRGPDDVGLYFDAENGVGLGHRRLSIIDLSSSGHQPMSYGDGRYWITYNGEVYNYRELRRELEKYGHSFRSQTDTEIILAAYAQWGGRCLKHLRGMFAFAIWDRDKEQLFLARDRLGIKPLLYCQKNGLFLFASELKAFLQSGLVDPIVDLESLFAYLAMGSAIQPKTFIQGIYQLEPGTSLTLNAHGDYTTERYWHLVADSQARRDDYSRRSFPELVEITRDKLEEACRLHLVADVPVGSFLSGGIDSTTITAMMARYAPYPIHSFSVGFPETDECQDELSYAKIAADYLGCRHTEVVLTGKEVAQHFEQVIDSIDQPSVDGLNTYFVSHAASRKVKVTLSGLGGDEFFAGYPHFAILARANDRKATMVDHFLALVHKLRPNRFTIVSHNRCVPFMTQLAGLRRIFQDGDIQTALEPSLRRTFHPGFLEELFSPYRHDGLDTLAHISLAESRGYLLNTLLRDNDVMSMAHSLEVRPVLLDHPFMEHVFALPPDAKIRNGVLKAALIEAVRDLLPEETVTRKKMGFTMPIGTWLKTELRDRLLDCVTDREAQTIFSSTFLKQCAAGLGNYRYTMKLWALLIFWEWFRKNRCALSA